MSVLQQKPSGFRIVARTLPRLQALAEQETMHEGRMDDDRVASSRRNETTLIVLNLSALIVACATSSTVPKEYWCNSAVHLHTVLQTSVTTASLEL